MKIYVDGKMVDPEREMVVIIFDNDEDRKRHAQNISNMEEKEGRRVYAIYSDHTGTNEIHQTIIQALCAL